MILSLLYSMVSIVRFIAFSLWVISTTTLWALFVLIISPIILIPLSAARKGLYQLTQRSAKAWSIVQYWGMRFVLGVTVEADPLPGYTAKGRYIVTSNHQSNFDTFVLFYLAPYDLPCIRCFIKHAMLWIPLFNIGVSLMNFPILKRFPKEALAKDPSLRFKDQDTIRRAAKRLSETSFSLVHYSEGTRRTMQKRDKLQGDHRYLLPARAGGLAMFVADLDKKIDKVYDVSILYPMEFPRDIDFILGRVRKIRVLVREVSFPDTLYNRAYSDAQYRTDFKAWLDRVWEEKDAVIGQARAISDAST